MLLIQVIEQSIAYFSGGLAEEKMPDKNHHQGLTSLFVSMHRSRHGIFLASRLSKCVNNSLTRVQTEMFLTKATATLIHSSFNGVLK